MKVFILILAFLSVFGLASCTSLEEKLPSYDELLRAETEQDGKACVLQNRIRNFGAANKNLIWFSSGKEQYYLTTTLSRCNSLLTSYKIGFEGDFSKVCGGRNDKFYTSEEACIIKGIFKFDNYEESRAALDNIETIREKIEEETKKQALEDNAE